eukprot:6209824-Pleurochrysis_carterae.AAC.5
MDKETRDHVGTKPSFQPHTDVSHAHGKGIAASVALSAQCFASILRYGTDPGWTGSRHWKNIVLRQRAAYRDSRVFTAALKEHFSVVGCALYQYEFHVDGWRTTLYVFILRQKHSNSDTSFDSCRSTRLKGGPTRKSNKYRTGLGCSLVETLKFPGFGTGPRFCQFLIPKKVISRLIPKIASLHGIPKRTGCNSLRDKFRIVKDRVARAPCCHMHFSASGSFGDDFKGCV